MAAPRESGMINGDTQQHVEPHRQYCAQKKSGTNEVFTVLFLFREITRTDKTNQ